MFMVCGRPQDGEGVQVHVDACGQREEWRRGQKPLIHLLKPQQKQLGGLLT